MEKVETGLGNRTVTICRSLTMVEDVRTRLFAIMAQIANAAMAVTTIGATDV